MGVYGKSAELTWFMRDAKETSRIHVESSIHKILVITDVLYVIVGYC